MAFFSKRPAEFGSCCQELKDSLTIPQERFFSASEEGVLYITIGGIQTEDGMSYLDRAVLFCPFCGRRLQTVEEIRQKAGSPTIQ